MTLQLFNPGERPCALSIIQPFASLCVLVSASGLGEKEFETRDWECRWARNLSPRDVFIHASKDYPRWARDLTLTEPFRSVLRSHDYGCAGMFDHGAIDLPCGAIVGRTRILGSLKTEVIADRLSAQELAFGNYEPGRIAIRLAEPFPFGERYVPCSGALGLWDISGDLQRAMEVIIG